MPLKFRCSVLSLQILLIVCFLSEKFAVRAYNFHFSKTVDFDDLNVSTSLGVLDKIGSFSVSHCASLCLLHSECLEFAVCYFPSYSKCLLWIADVHVSVIHKGHAVCYLYMYEMDNIGTACVNGVYNRLTSLCACSTYWYGQNCEKKYRDCQYISDGDDKTGMYSMVFQGMNFYVTCQMLSDGAWTVLVNRVNDGKEFGAYSDSQYEQLIGTVTTDLSKTYWLGLKAMAQLLTAYTGYSSYQIRVDVETMSGNVWFAVYESFYILNEDLLKAFRYKIFVGRQISGNHDLKLEYNNGSRFQVYPNCINAHRYMFWFTANPPHCTRLHLLGQYGTNGGFSLNAEGQTPILLKKASLKIKQNIL